MNFDFHTSEDGQSVAKIIFESWKNFYPERLLEEDGDNPPGEIDVIIGDAGTICEMQELTSEKLVALNYTYTNQTEVKTAILNALLPLFKEWREEFEEDMDDEEITEDMEMPKIISPEQFSEVILPCAIYLLDSAEDGVAHTGFCFYASWEDEHGLGVIVHKNKVIKIGPMDIAMHSHFEAENSSFS